MFLAAALFSLAACNKEEAFAPANADEGEIVLIIDDGSIDMGVETKASAITSVPSSLNWLASTGAWKSETVKWSPAAGSVSSGKLATGKYQTNSATAYNYYVSNGSMAFAAGGSTIAAENTIDVIAGCTTAATTSTAPSITLDHVFARTGTLTCNTQTGFDIKNVSWKIQGAGTKGTYNIATKTWSGLTALAQTAITSSSDMYLVPGSYTITVSYTLYRGDYSEDFTKSGTVTLTAGKKNNISCTAIGGRDTSIKIGVTLTDWGTENKTLTLG